MRKLVCVGACYLDTILSVPHYPEEDSKLRATELHVRRGGNCPNTLEVLQQLLAEQPGPGVTPYLVSCLPSADAVATARIKESFGPKTPVDFSACIYREGHSEPASSYIIRSEGNGSRTLVNYNELPEMTTEEFKAIAAQIGDDAWWHFEGRTPDTILQSIHHLRRSCANVKISVEVEKPGRKGLEELAAEADVVFYSRSWAEAKQHESAEDCLRAQRVVARKATLLLCTWGSQGAACLSAPDGSVLHCPAVVPNQAIRVVDSVGAGDSFVAGLLYGLLCHSHDWDLQAQLRFAVQLATNKVVQEGFGGVGAKTLKTFTISSSDGKT